MTIKNTVILTILGVFFFSGHVHAQDIEEGYIYRRADGKFLMASYVQPNGDTILYAQLREIEIKAPKSFASAQDYKRWEKYRYYAPTVVGYAAEAVRAFRQLEAATRDGSRRDRKQYIKQLEEQMEDRMRIQLKNLTRTQGFLLIKMIERELHMPFYDLVKDVKGGFSAFYWNEFGKMYGYQLKQGYIRGEDALLDAILDQYDLYYYMR